MKIYLVIETADCEILGVTPFTELNAAKEHFSAVEMESGSLPCKDLGLECTGTLLLSGDDSYAIQLIETEVKN